MTRRRRPVTNAGPHLEKLRAFRQDVLIPILSSVPPTHPQYKRASEANDAVLALADELAGETGVLLGKGHSTP